jgi:hypothetical protein
MTMQHLPRPWMLAALMDVPVALLARSGQELARGCPAPTGGAAPPAERTAGARQWCHAWYGEDAWGGAERWRDVEIDRAA